MMEKKIKGLEEIIYRIIAPEINKIFSFTVFGLVNINQVKISNDGLYADVLVDIFQKRGQFLSLLNVHRPKLQSYLVKILKRRQTPKLRFVITEVQW